MLAISDTHGNFSATEIMNFIKRRKMKFHVLMFCGDVTSNEDTKQQKANLENKIISLDKQTTSMKSFVQEMKILDKVFDYIFIVFGNHDGRYGNNWDQTVVQNWFSGTKNIHILNNGSYTIDLNRYQHLKDKKDKKLKFYGLSYAEKDQSKYQVIPNDTNILMTHVPPRGILAAKLPIVKIRSSKGLKKRIKEISKYGNLKLHVFGHAHSHSGKIKTKRRIPGVIFHNAAVKNNNFEVHEICCGFADNEQEE